MHTPVLTEEVLMHLPDVASLRMVDATLNGGGHSAAIIEAFPDARILGIEWDPDVAHAFLQHRPHLQDAVTVVNDTYVNLEDICRSRSFVPDAVLMDLGISSWHVDTSTRGFTFMKDQPLDMRFDPRSGNPTAADVVNTTDEEELIHIFRELGEERFAPEIAAAIVHRHRREPLLTTFQLVQVIAGAVPAGYRHGKLHFATKTFQALRMAVNDELGNVQRGIAAALRTLKRPGGRLMIIAFHGGEDRLVRELFKEAAREGHARWVQRRTIRPLWQEMKRNPRARSAKLKILETV